MKDKKPIRVSCFGCKTFESLTPIEKICMFRGVFDLLHKDNEDLFLKIIEKHGIGGYLNCELCSWDTPGGRGLYEKGYYVDRRLEESRQKEKEKSLTSNDPVVRNYAKRLIAEDKLKEMGVWPDGSIWGISLGISQRPYLDEKFVNQLSDEEATLLFLDAFQLKQLNQQLGEHDSLVDLVVNLDQPLDKLVKSFTEILKSKQTAYNKELHKADGRLKLPDFEKWDMYIRAFILKERHIKANLLNPEWPSRKLIKRQEIASLLFGDAYGDNLQKLDRYVNEARKLINPAKLREGPFKYCT